MACDVLCVTAKNGECNTVPPDPKTSPLVIVLFLLANFLLTFPLSWTTYNCNYKTFSKKQFILFKKML